VRVIQKIKETFNAQMTETCVSQILYELNGIWRTIMRKEADAVKKHFTGMVQDLRRQLVTKRAFDEEEAHKEITRLKKELHFLQKTNANKKNKSSASGDLQQQTKENTAANAFKRPETDKRSEATELRNKITQLERQRLNHNANVIGPLSAMSQQQYSDIDASSQRYGGAREEIGPSFFGKNSTFGGHMAGSGAGTVVHEADNVSQGYSDFA
jgi:hypothetical protein